MTTFLALIQCLRPHQWVKNFFLFLPLFFGRQITNPESVIPVMLLFIGFSAITGGVYIFNDLCDTKSDVGHPEKKRRPIAAGIVSKKLAIFLLIFVMGGGWIWLICTIRNYQIFALVFAYLAMNVAYSLWLKQSSFAGIVIVALGFVVRIFLGGLAGHVAISEWIVVMTFLLALFLAIAKRRDSIRMALNKKPVSTDSLLTKTLEFYNALLYICAAIVIIAYILYTLDPITKQRFGDYVYLTGLFTILGIFRYLQLIFLEDNAGCPTTAMLKDRWLQGIILCWLGAFWFFAYGGQLGL